LILGTHTKHLFFLAVLRRASKASRVSLEMAWNLGFFIGFYDKIVGRIEEFKHRLIAMHLNIGL
jgi:hypothetical protein